MIETKEYQLEVSRYIHRNPSEANLGPAPVSYRWSSYRAFVLNEQNEHVKTDKLLWYFSEPVREKYREYVESS